MATHYYPETPRTWAHTDGGEPYQSWSGGSRDGTSEVEAFIWRCRQHHDDDRNARYNSCGNRDMDAATVATFTKMLTDVHTRCRTMEDQLTDLQSHTQRVTSQLDSMATHRGRRASPSASATSVSSSSADTLMRAIRKLQWKIFDLQRENESLRALLEMQSAKEQTETVEAHHRQVEAELPAESADAAARTRPRNASSDSPRQPPPPAQATVTPSTPQSDNLPQEAQERRLSDSRVVMFMNPGQGLTGFDGQQRESTGPQQDDMGRQQERTTGHKMQSRADPHESSKAQRGSGWYPREESESSTTSSRDDGQHQQDSGVSDEFNQPLERREADRSSGRLRELKVAPARGTMPARYPFTRWTSSDSHSPRGGQGARAAARKAWKMTSPHPRPFPRASAAPSAQAGYSPVPNPRYQPALVNSSSVVDGSQDASPKLDPTGEDVAISSTSDCPCVGSNHTAEDVQYFDGYPCTGELMGDCSLEEFNLYATPEDIQLVQGTLELLNSINKLEYAQDFSQ